MPLTAPQKADFKRDGLLHLPGAISGELIENALHAINHRLGQGVPADELRTWQSQSFFPELQSQNVITDLFNASGLLETLRDLMGEANVAPATVGQLALRFPRAPGSQIRPPHAHIDGVHSPDNGVHSPDNGVPKGTIHSFSALVGVFLTDVNHDNAGNFTVWPGSHLKMQDYFREHGTDIITGEGRTPPIEKGEPHQIKARAGDAVLAHYQLLHGVAGNFAPRPRYATFFRVKPPEHETHRIESLTDLWREWPGI